MLFIHIHAFTSRFRFFTGILIKKCKGDNNQCTDERVPDEKQTCFTANEYNGKEQNFCGIQNCEKESDCKKVGNLQTGYYQATACTDGKCDYSPIRQFSATETKECQNLANCKRVGNQEEYYSAEECSNNGDGGTCVYPKQEIRNCKDADIKCNHMNRACIPAKNYEGEKWGFCGIKNCRTISNCVNVGNQDEYYKATACTDGECVYSDIRQFRQTRPESCKRVGDCWKIGNQDEFKTASKCYENSEKIRTCVY